MDTGTVQYYSGIWRDLGTTLGGQVTKELLPLSYPFSMNYAFARQEKTQNVASDATVVFQTTKVTVQLKDSGGNLMDTGTVQYYSGGWQNFGVTSTGQVSKELLPLTTYSFSMNYAYARQEKSQNVGTDATVIFQTKLVTVELRDSTGALMDTGTVQYYSGVWRDMGTTSGGQVTMELLPLSYPFSMNYAYARQEKSQNVGTDATVIFQTKLVTMKLLASDGTTELAGDAEYYANGYKTFGSGTTTATMELLPISYPFRVSYTGDSLQKNQNVATDPIVVFHAATVSLSNLTQTYDGTAKLATVVTTPAGLSVSVTYNGSATPPTDAGSYAVVAIVHDPNYIGRASDILVITKATITITADAQTKVYGEAKTFAGTEFTTVGLLGSDTVTSVTLISAGAAPSATVAGSPYTITPSAAVGTGLNNYNINYVVGSLTVNKASTTVELTSSCNPSLHLLPVTFTVTVAAVAPGAGTPTGTVTFKDGTTTLGTATLSSGKATYRTPCLRPLRLGDHSITAVYNGDASFTTSTSPALTQTVLSLLQWLLRLLGH
jgi:hypothetical protein